MRAGLIACGALLVTGERLTAQEVDFARDVLPLLSDRCFACHGPDAGSRKADLRLDERDAALAARDGGAAVVPGDAHASALFLRITSQVGDERMPPADSKLSLVEAEIDVLRRWIEQGAKWSTHWAFVAPAASEPPSAGDGWAKNELDRFVFAALAARGRSPSPAAAPGELLRRVMLDLTGLPPTPEQLAGFERDPSDANYERIVDALLASPRYGERMAWPWLEAARYADTDGYQSDPTRQMWPWRDWLVRQLNNNVPFDRLTLLLLAGDLLPDASEEQRLASAFHRNHAYNGEGGRIAEETRVENVFDRTETTATVWLGMTFECARCHDHKFDPVTQRDYYSLSAFFDQTSEDGSLKAPGKRPPTFRYLGEQRRRRLAELEQQVAARRSRRDGPDEELDRQQREWEAATAALVAAAPETFVAVGNGPWRELGPRERAADPLALGPEQPWRLATELAEGRPYMFAEVPGATYLERTISARSARRLTLSFGSDDGIRVFWNGALVLDRADVRRAVAPDQERVTFAVRQGPNDLLIEVVNAGGPGGFWFRHVEEVVDGIPLDIAPIVAADETRRTAAERTRVREHFRSERMHGYDELAAAIERAEAERQQLEGSAPEVMVMDDLPADQRRTTHVLERGAYDRPLQAVTADVPTFLPPLPEDSPKDRIALARWLTSPEHPLTARVAVNRAWQTIFGRGLVETSEDFGRQGSGPTHPELLDWLAREFVASGWDGKALHRRIVLSATYRQSAAAPPQAFVDDPEAALLQRAPRRRLPSWLLRDQALALGGLLVERVGGEPVRPYQPAGVWAEATFDTIRYEQDRGEALFRRSLYTFWRRIVGPTTLFDTPSRQSCTVRSTMTNSPLHALVTLNDTTYVEAARGLAERAWREGHDVPARLAWAFRAATARVPQPEELQVLVDRWHAAWRRFDADPGAASRLLAVGATTADQHIDQRELAATAVVTMILLNLDEVLTRP